MYDVKCIKTLNCNRILKRNTRFTTYYILYNIYRYPSCMYNIITVLYYSGYKVVVILF